MYSTVAMIKLNSVFYIFNTSTCISVQMGISVQMEKEKRLFYKVVFTKCTFTHVGFQDGVQSFKKA